MKVTILYMEATGEKVVHLDPQEAMEKVLKHVAAGGSVHKWKTERSIVLMPRTYPGGI
jgi:hypothetical protein